MLHGNSSQDKAGPTSAPIQDQVNDVVDGKSTLSDAVPNPCAACTHPRDSHASVTDCTPALITSPPSKKQRQLPHPPEPVAHVPVSGRKLAKKRAKRNSRRGQNHRRAQNLQFGDQEANARVRQNAIERGGVVHVDFDVNALPAAKGGWVGLRGRFSGEKRAYSLEELVKGDSQSKDPALKVFQWTDG